jgi:hypothetical protein
MALNEERALAGIQAGCQQEGGERASLLTQALRVMRDRERVEVDDAEVIVLGLLPSTQRLTAPR